MKKILILIFIMTNLSTTWAMDFEDNFDFYVAAPIEYQQAFKDFLKEDEWMYVNKNERYTYYINYNRIRTLPNGIVETWFRLTVNQKIPEGHLAPGDFIMKRDSFDCHKYTSKALSAIAYNHHTGDVVSSYDYPSYKPYTAVIPGSLGELHFKRACFLDSVKKYTPKN